MSQQILSVHSRPANVDALELTGSTVVVIDLLRASTSITWALASGATAVVPFLEVDELLAAAEAANDRSTIVLGGERGGRRIEGFDLGNSPAEFTPAAVGGKHVLLTTTNGTRALAHARTAERIIVGAAVNLSAVAESVKDAPRIDILCAGTDGRDSRDDLLAAGALVDALCRMNGDWQMNTVAESAVNQWRALVADADATGRSVSQQLAIELRDTAGGRNLIDIGMDDDLVASAAIDSMAVVPELDQRHWQITLR